MEFRSTAPPIFTTLADPHDMMLIGGGVIRLEPSRQGEIIGRLEFIEDWRLKIIAVAVKF